MLRKVLIAIGGATVAVLITGTGWGQSPFPGAVGLKATVLMQATKTSIGQDFQYPLLRPQITMALLKIAPGGQTGRHMHPVPIVLYVLEGTFTQATEGHGEKVLNAGDTVVESMNTWHNGMNRGMTTAKAIAVVIGEEGKPSRINP